MTNYIYKITSPNNKIYIGKTVTPIKNKISYYKRIEHLPYAPNRKIVNAIKKYKWENMLFEIVEENDTWSFDELNNREKYWISYYNSMIKGYNMTPGGDGIPSDIAKHNTTHYHSSMTAAQRLTRNKNCSIGQIKRFSISPETIETRTKKSKSHCGHYIIISPMGIQWETTEGLAIFYEQNKDALGISYGTLFNAYRKTYENKTNTRVYKNENKWKVTRVDR